MLITITVEFISLFFIMAIFISFIVRKRDDSSEVSFFWKLLLTNILGLILEIYVTFTTAYSDLFPLLTLVLHRFYMLLIILEVLYVCSFSSFLYNYDLKNTKRGKIFIRVLQIIFVLEAIFVTFLPVAFHVGFSKTSRYVSYATGWAVESIIIYGILLFLLTVYFLLRYRNYYYKQRLLSILFYSLVLTSTIIIRKFFIGYTVIFPTFTLVTVMIYFIIENYDVKRATQLKELSIKADNLNEAKNRFLSNMSREIRTNLNTIVVTSSLLLESDIDEETKDELNDIVYASDSLLEIVGNILDLNKIENEEMKVNIEEYNLKREAESLADMTSIRIENKPINFIMNIDQSIPDVLKGDKAHVKQVINNLLTNAFKYTNEGTVVFNVRCDNDLETSICHITIEVKDTGIGIKDTSRLFNKFDRLDMDKESNIEGTGLGLVITKKIVELMNGKIDVESELGKGSKFTVTFDQEISDGKELVKEKELNLDYSFGNRRILVVDDNRFNLKVAKLLFNKFGLKIDCCNSGKEAKEVLKNNGYDVIFTDIVMSNNDGIDVLNEGKKYNTPVVALTADAIQGAKEKYLELGFADYIAKPYTDYDIYKVLDGLFRKE